MATEVISEIRGQSLIVTFNRPEHANALTLDMANQLFQILKPATTDRGIRAVLLRGRGGHFMDSVDMDLYAGDWNIALEMANQLILPYHSAIRELQSMDKPVIAAVDGIVAGAGFCFMLASDLVLAGRNTKFNCEFASRALTPDGGCSYYLPRKVGAAKATELLMLSETFGAEEAKNYNLISRILDEDKLHEEALTWLDRLASGPTRAYGGIKKLIMKSFEQDINAQLGLEHTYFGASSRTFDFREVVKAHLANRPAKFTGS